MAAPTIEASMRDHLLTVWRCKYLIVLATLIAALGVFFWRSSMAKTYVADTTVRLAVVDDDGIDNGLITDFVASTYADLAETPVLLDDAIASSGLAIDVEEASERISTDFTQTPGFLILSATGPSPEDAASLVTGLAESLLANLSSDMAVRPRDGAATTELRAEVVKPTFASTTPLRPQPLREAVVAGIVAAILAAEGSVIWRRLRGGLSLSDPAAQVAEIAGAPTFRVTDLESGSDQAAFVSVAQLLFNDETAAVVVQEGEASASVAIALAEASTGIANSVFLIDCDVGLPVMSKALRLNSAPGVAEAFLGQEPTVHQPLGRRFYAIGSGNSAATLTSRETMERMPAWLSGLPADASLVNVTASSDIRHRLNIAHAVGGPVALVVEDKGLSKREVRELAGYMRSTGSELAAVILHAPSSRASARRNESDSRRRSPTPA